MKIEEFLKQNQDADLLRFSTAGSVDDGKSTLIGRLLHDCKAIYEDQLKALRKTSGSAGEHGVDYALLTDGLKSEREQGITIDVAYRYFSTPNRRFIIADTPGHEQYTRNMATGASTAQLAVILIDARNGVITQSKRHTFISTLLNIPHFLVAINKMDLVDYSQDVFNQIKSDFLTFASHLQITDLDFIPISALHGDNIVEKSEHMPWYKGGTFVDYLEKVYVGGKENLVDFRFPVQCVLRPNLDFRGYCGTIASGVVRKGDAITVLPSGRTTRVKDIVTYDGELKTAFAPQAVTIRLEDEIDIARGDMLVHSANRPVVCKEVEAMVVWMSEETLKLNKPYYIKHTTNTVRGVVSKLHYRVSPNDLSRRDAETLGLNEIGRIELHAFKPLLCDPYKKNSRTGSFILIDELSNNTVAAGMLIDRNLPKSGLHPVSQEAKPVSDNISRHGSLVVREERQSILGQKGATFWFTGLSGSGKSTLAYAFEKRLLENGRVAYVLDGDNIRFGLNKDLGFSPNDRAENIRRIAEVAKLFNDAGVIVITSFISPYRADRQMAKEIIGADAFIECHVSAPLEVCEQRDPKGLYQKARKGDIPSFTGISAPYEGPLQPEFVLDTVKNSAEVCTDELFAYAYAKLCDLT